jgi:hypothetical protein
VHLNVSLDSWGNRAEYIREGTVWTTLEANIKKIKVECPHMHIGIASVISAFNIHSLPEFIDYLETAEIIDNKTSASFYCLLNPNFYSFDILDQKFKNEIMTKLAERVYTENIKSQLDNVIRHLKNSTTNVDLQRQFKHHTDYYDSIRNKKFTDTFPELTEFYENIL